MAVGGLSMARSSIDCFEQHWCGCVESRFIKTFFWSIDDIMNNYSKSLAQFLFKKLEDHQTDPIITKERPRLHGSGFYFSEQDIEKWIEEHNGPNQH